VNKTEEPIIRVDLIGSSYLFLKLCVGIIVGLWQKLLKGEYHDEYK